MARLVRAFFFEELVAAVDGDRQDRHLRLLGEFERTGFELSHLMPLRAVAFREDDEVEALIKKFLRLTERLDGLFRVVPHEEDRASGLDHIPECRVLPPLVLSDIAELVAVLHQPEGRRDVSEALMVAVYHERSVVRDVLFTMYLEGHAQLRSGVFDPAALPVEYELLFFFDLSLFAKPVYRFLEAHESSCLDISEYKSVSGREWVHHVFDSLKNARNADSH